MNVLSLFDGMSCGQIALDRLGIKVDNYFASEIDKFAMQVAKDNYPNTTHIGDVTKVKAGDLPKIDLLIGGSPCQGFSFAGKQLNFEDERSKLFFEFVRLLKECKPKHFMLENVVMKKESQDVISEYLGVEPILINSALVSAQNRKRLYWTSLPDVTQPEDENIPLICILQSGSTDREKSFCLLSSYRKIGNATDARVRDYLGKARGQMVFCEKGEYRKLTPVECERLQTVPCNYTKAVSNTQRYKMLGNGWTVDVIVHILKGISEA